MLPAFRHSLRCLTATLSMLLMLGAVVASGQAQAAHTIGMVSSASLPCNHALESDGAMPIAKSPLDLCRDLCLSQAPDTLLIPASIAPDVRVVLTSSVVNMFTADDALPTRAETHRVAPAPRLRRAPYPATPRLLI